MPLIGTAGHVDHGKSTLIQRITGTNPDRWDEERTRGLTIDLGFAWTRLPGGIEVSFVDVPGHERFLKNMLAGIEAIDVALFVVAADEGWMPQSEEHLAVLDLLGVERGVVALTKIDLVDEDLLDLARSEVSERLAGTGLAEAPIVPVSATTGEGIENLLEELDFRTPTTTRDRGRPRLWVDRSFAISGAGTVVTGTLLDGSLAADDHVVVLPAGASARIRSIQSHEETHDTIGPGRRVALNLGGIDHDRISRGDMVAREGQWDLTSRFAASLRAARFVDAIDPRGAYQIHIGSSAHVVDITGAEKSAVMLTTGAPLPLAVGDRFILRDTGRRLVVGGGRILDPHPGPTRRSLKAVPDVDPDAAADTVAGHLLDLRGIDQLDRLAAHSGGGTPVDAVVVDGLAITPATFRYLGERALRLVDQEHKRYPLRPGLPLATLAGRLDVTASVAGAVVDSCDGLVRSGPDVARTEHTMNLNEQQRAVWEGAKTRLEQGLAVPDEDELGLDPEVTAHKLRTGELVRIGPRLVYLAEQARDLRQSISALDDGFTIGDFRDALGLSRKYAVPILEWSDKEGLTFRRGDVRHVR